MSVNANGLFLLLLSSFSRLFFALGGFAAFTPKYIDCKSSCNLPVPELPSDHDAPAEILIAVISLPVNFVLSLEFKIQMTAVPHIMSVVSIKDRYDDVGLLELTLEKTSTITTTYNGQSAPKSDIHDFTSAYTYIRVGCVDGSIHTLIQDAEPVSAAIIEVDTSDRFYDVYVSGNGYTMGFIRNLNIQGENCFINASCFALF